MVNSWCGRTATEVACRERLNFIQIHKDEIIAAMDMGPLLDAIGDAAIEKAADLADALAALRDRDRDAAGQTRAKGNGGGASVSCSDVPDPGRR